MSHPPASLTRAVRRGLAIGWWAALFLVLAAWILPVEIVENWAAGRARNDDFSKIEAARASANALVFLRWALSATTLVLFSIWLAGRKSAPLISHIIAECWHSMTPVDDAIRWRAVASRLFLMAWLMLAVWHVGASVSRRLWDWPVYRLYDGKTVLPNISDHNRDVIRYLNEATPSNARILVLSDQKLYFLSYYLLPRRLYHPMHPDSEFVIPQPYNQRQLAAYRLAELSPERIEKLRPDYILEYFEGEPFTKDRNLEQDLDWVSYKRRRNQSWRPQYLVALRKYSGEGAP